MVGLADSTRGWRRTSERLRTAPLPGEGAPPTEKAFRNTNTTPRPPGPMDAQAGAPNAAREQFDDVAVGSRDQKDRAHHRHHQVEGEIVVLPEVEVSLLRAVGGRRQPVGPEPHPREKGDQRQRMVDTRVEEVLGSSEKERPQSVEHGGTLAARARAPPRGPPAHAAEAASSPSGGTLPS